MLSGRAASVALACRECVNRLFIAFGRAGSHTPGIPLKAVAVLITTGKNADKHSRAIARALHAAVPHSLLEFRGKRSLSALIAKARKAHCSRVCAIYNAQGRPHALSFLSIGDDGSWQRLKPAIIVENAPLSIPRMRLAQSCCLKITGARAKEAMKLFSPANDGDCEQDSRMVAGKGTLAIYRGKRKTLSLGVKYEG